MMTVFLILPGIIWFAGTNFHDQDVDYLENNILETFKDLVCTKEYLQ